MNPEYEIILYWSEDDQAFVAEVPELPDCMVHGDSRARWIAAAEEFGRAVPAPKGRRLAYA